MNVMVLGSGGREHALVWKLAQSSRVTRIVCAPGNAGMGQEKCKGGAVECRDISVEDFAGLLVEAKAMKADLIVVGPDNPLALGVVDFFEKQGFAIWGPNQQAAQFESSKAFSQEFMQRHGIPTAAAGIFSDPVEAGNYARRLGGRCVVKTDGLALGKGALVCQNLEESLDAIHQLMVLKTLGEAGAKVVIQEFMEGVEVSMHVLCDGKSLNVFPSSQDHKRAFDGDQGPNTGGMGTYSPAPFLKDEDLEAIQRSILKPWIRGCLQEGIDYRGLLYPGLMLTSEGPKVVEFNARFGDPETQVYMPRLKTDLVGVFEACLQGTLDQIQLEWYSHEAVCVVMASQGYPGSYPKGKLIRGLDAVKNMEGLKVFHAGTRKSPSGIETSGGRVLGVTGWAESLEEARKKAYAAVDRISFEGAWCRKDIAHQVLGRD